MYVDNDVENKILPEDEDEESQESEEDGNIVHCLQHHYQLSPEVWQESDQLQDPQQSECS